ncbi:MAG: uracil-DNA glycosylase family protein, partial [Polyangiales bacterium]
MSALVQIKRHVTRLKGCTDCPDMIGPVVTGAPVVSPVMLVGQAPGDKEGPAGKPFAWTAGKTMFQWFASLGMSEDQFRSRV